VSWNTKLDAVLVSLGFARSKSKHAVYVREGDEKVLYVDDLIVTGASLAAISAFKEEMCWRLKMSDLGVLCLYLGIEVSQQPGRITLKQSSFTTKLLEKAGRRIATALMSQWSLG
jgi:adenine/guanine phosphoribosyltransferase-like PRPP-binding protein